MDRFPSECRYDYFKALKTARENYDLHDLCDIRKLLRKDSPDELLSVMYNSFCDDRLVQQLANAMYSRYIEPLENDDEKERQRQLKQLRQKRASWETNPCIDIAEKEEVDHLLAQLSGQEAGSIDVDRDWIFAVNGIGIPGKFGGDAWGSFDINQALAKCQNKSSLLFLQEAAIPQYVDKFFCRGNTADTEPLDEMSSDSLKRTLSYATDYDDGFHQFLAHYVVRHRSIFRHPRMVNRFDELERYFYDEEDNLSNDLMNRTPHDILAEIDRRREEQEARDYPPEDFNWLKDFPLFTRGECVLRVLSSSQEILRAGKLLHNCASTYISKVREKGCVLVQLEVNGKISALGEWSVYNGRWDQISEHCNKQIREEWRDLYHEMSLQLEGDLAPRLAPPQKRFDWCKGLPVFTRGDYVLRVLSSPEEIVAACKYFQISRILRKLNRVSTKYCVIVQMEVNGKISALGQWDGDWNQISEHCKKQIRSDWKDLYHEMSEQFKEDWTYRLCPPQEKFDWCKGLPLFTRGDYVLRVLSSPKEIVTAYKHFQISGMLPYLNDVSNKNGVIVQMEVNGEITALFRRWWNGQWEQLVEGYMVDVTRPEWKDQEEVTHYHWNHLTSFKDVLDEMNIELKDDFSKLPSPWTRCIINFNC